MFCFVIVNKKNKHFTRTEQCMYIPFRCDVRFLKTYWIFNRNTLKLQTFTCSTIYVDACMHCNGFVHLNAFLNILRDPIWFDKCSGRDTFERQFLKAFFFQFSWSFQLFQRSSWDRGLHYLLWKGFPFGMPKLFAKILMTP